MSRTIPALAALAVVFSCTAVVRADGLPRHTCPSGPSILACPGQGTGEIDVSGEDDGGGPSDAGTDQPASQLSITCGPGAANQLSGLGDLDVDGDVTTCQTQQVVCGAATLKPGQKESAVVRVEQQPGGSWAFAGGSCVITNPARVTAAMVRERAVRLIPSAKVGLAPHGTTLVNIETVMWADAPHQQSLSAVTILGKRVVIGLVLDHVSWRFGDGESDSDAPAGKAYDGKRAPCKTRECPGYYGHVYEHTGKVSVEATASWHASFTVAGGAQVDIPGTIDGPRATAALAVKQARGVLVPNPGDN